MPCGGFTVPPERNHAGPGTGRRDGRNRLDNTGKMPTNRDMEGASRGMGGLLARLPRLCLQAPVHAYRYLLSPLLGPSCRFQPSCSAYALEALETHGALRGGWLTLRRLLRCQPFTWLGGGSGYDPVPPPQRLEEKGAGTGGT